MFPTPVIFLRADELKTVAYRRTLHSRAGTLELHIYRDALDTEMLCTKMTRAKPEWSGKLLTT